MLIGRADGRRSGRVATCLASGAVVILSLSGCQGDADPVATRSPDQPSSSSSPTGAVPSPSVSAAPEPSPASSAGPAANLPVPVKPALADENTAEGLEAFTKYWFELFSYGYETNDWAPFEAVTDPGCRTCNKYVQVVQAIYDRGQYIRGGSFILEKFETDFVLNTQGSTQAFALNRQTNIEFHGANSEIIRTDTAPDSVVDSIFAVYSDNAWLLLDYGKPEGT